MEKPPITENLPKFRATDAEIQAVIKARHLDERDVPLAEQRMTAMTIILIMAVATTQRDADAAYAEEEIKGLFETIEAMYPELRQSYWGDKQWQSLKSKFMEGK